MLRPRRHAPTRRLSAIGVASVAIVAAAFVGSCGAVPSSTPSAAPSVAPSASITAVPADSASPSDGAGEPTQTDTDWGRIWDAVPATFPRPAGSVAADSIDHSPSSADLSVGAGPTEVADFYRLALKEQGYLVSVQGPLEDGSFVIDAGSGADCKLEVVITPLGDLAHVKILFGAGCAFG